MKQRTILFLLSVSLFATPMLVSPAFAIEAANLKIVTEKRNNKVIAVINRHVSNATAPLRTKDEQDFRYSRKSITRTASAGDSDPIRLSDSFIDDVVKLSGAFGITSSAELSPFELKEDNLGMKHVRYRQILGGVGVFGAELIAHITKNGEVSSVNGRTLAERSVNTISKLTAEDAAQIAKADANNNLELQGLSAATGFTLANPPSLYVYNQGFVSGKDETKSLLVWQMILLGKSAQLNVEYLIDAHNGAVVKAESTVRGINRTIFECVTDEFDGICYSNLQTAFPYVYTFGRREGTPARGPNPVPGPYFGSTDVDIMYDLFPVLHNYYQNKFARDGGNSRGGIGDGTTTAPYTSSRAFVNVNNEGMGIGASCATSAAWFSYNSVSFCYHEITNDIAGHEYAHAVSYNMSFNPNGSRNSLLYEEEPGALNESFSDVMGEMFEFHRTGANDWIVGTNSTINHHVRNLANPHAAPGPKLYPDRFFDPNFSCVPDTGGGSTTVDHVQVHTNSSVPNHAAALASQGGTFNGCTITGIGNAKLEQIWYRALTTYYTTTESFNSAYNSHIQACNDLYSPADCEQVTKALQAVEMDQNGSCGAGGTPRLPDCAGSCYLSSFASI